MLNEIWKWIQTNYALVISLIIKCFIAYHVYFLSNKLTEKGRLNHKEEILKQCEELFQQINQNDESLEVHIVNTKRYFKDYPSNERDINGYSHLKAELKSVRYNGLEFFNGMPVNVYRKEDGHLSFQGDDTQFYRLAFPVGLVPYEWIDHIALYGDEYGCVPQIFCQFKNRIDWDIKILKNNFLNKILNWILNKILKGYPFKETFYYYESEVFHPGNDPFIMKYMRITEPISNE